MSVNELCVRKLRVKELCVKELRVQKLCVCEKAGLPSDAVESRAGRPAITRMRTDSMCAQQSALALLSYEPSIGPKRTSRVILHHRTTR